MGLKSFETPGIQMSWEASGNKTRHLKSKRQVNYYPNLGRITKGVSGVPLIALGPGPECQGFKLHTSIRLRPKICHHRAQQPVCACAAVLKVSAFCREVKSKSFCLIVIIPQGVWRSPQLFSSASLHSAGQGGVGLSSSIWYYQCFVELVKCPHSDEAAWRIKACTRKPICPFFPHQNPDVCPRDAPVDADS